MRVVDDKYRIMLPAQLHQLWQRGDGAFHREHAVRNDHPGAAVPRGNELLLEVGEIGMPVDRGLALDDRLGETGRVDDGRVIELIADYDVLLAQHRGRKRLVGVPRAHEAERGARADEACARGLQRAVHREGAADEANRGRPGPPAIQSSFPRGDHFGLGAQAQIVVGRQNDDLTAAFHTDPGGLRAVQVVQPLVHAVTNELLQLGLEPTVERGAHAATSKITLPAWPSFMTWMASAIESGGKRWVMTGRGSNWPARRKRRISSQVSYILRPVTP